MQINDKLYEDYNGGETCRQRLGKVYLELKQLREVRNPSHITFQYARRLSEDHEKP